MTVDVFAHCNLRQMVFRQRERRWQMQRNVWLGVACLGIVVAAPVSAQQPILRDTLERGDQGWISSLSFSPDGKTLASAGDESITLWDVSSGKAIRHFKHSGVVLSVDFSPDGKTLASGSSDQMIKLWELSSAK